MRKGGEQGEGDSVLQANGGPWSEPRPPFRGQVTGQEGWFVLNQ